MNDNTVASVRPQDVDTAAVPTLDVRAHTGGKQIRGALRYDRRALLKADPLTLPLPRESRVIVYADDDASASEVAARLKQQGYGGAAVLEGGFEAYKALDLPVEDATQEQPVPGNESTGIPRA